MTSPLFYLVRWLKGDAVLGEEAFEYLTDAKGHAQIRLSAQRARKGATAAEVVDRDGVVYFRFGAADASASNDSNAP